MKLSSLTQKKIWSVYPAAGQCSEFAKKLRISPLIAQLLINRGITTPEAGKSFLQPKLSDLVEPEKMPGVGAAVERIAKAVRDREKITIYGDYDVDGITATAILFQLLKMLDANVDYYIPHRLDEGYGLNAEAIEKIAAAGTNVLITVDCGVTAFKSAALAAELKMDLIITDHHQFAAGQLPQAVAIVHAGLDKSYPWQSPSGAMVAFKLAWAVANSFKVNGKTDPKLREFLINATVLAAMGTIADVVDISGENRIITSFGLRAMADTEMTGLKSLIEMVRLTNEAINSYHVGFCIAPILNAAGRMGHARLAVELLTGTNRLNSIKITQYLKQQNNQRKQYERKIFAQASEMVSGNGMNHPDRRSIVIGSSDWHTGVIGIVASRMVDKYYRPAIMINISEDKAQGSARSIPGFDI
ncbi:MAG: single-stranded-DNA-specific exonuclease RecJ, partial [Planctomycetes bacterium]|nr:single-stranded-DNA-specific exonuclease RecJ [Planctomycetota bacterium]